MAYAQATSDKASFAAQVRECAVRGVDGVSDLLDLVIATAARLSASDVHLEPTGGAMLVRLRLDGVMHDFGELPGRLAPNLAARAKVLAGLLTYRTDVPQEGGEVMTGVDVSPLVCCDLCSACLIVEPCCE